MQSIKHPYRISLSKIKRWLVGGCWVKHNDEPSCLYCKKSLDANGIWNGGLTHWDGKHYCGYHRTLVSITSIEDYGDVSWLGKMLGYSDTDAKRLPIMFPWDIFLNTTVLVLVVGYFLASFLGLYPFGNHC